MVDVGGLETMVADLRRAAGDVAPHTLRSYERRWRMWEAFVDHYGISAVPADGRHVAAFVVARHAAGVSPSGIAANLSAVSWFHRRLDDRLDPVGDARAVLRVLSKREPAPPIEPAPVLSVGALLAMVGLPAVLGVGFATKLVRSVLADLRPRQLLTVRGSELVWGPDDAWADVVVHDVPANARHRALPGCTVRLRADPGWVACPVRALRLLVSQAGEGPLFDEHRLYTASTRSMRASDVQEGVHARLHVRDAAVVCVGYAGALRVEELSRARVEHLEARGEGFVLRLRDAKTARSRPNQSVRLGRRDDALDPVAAIHRWLAVRGDHDGPLFVNVHHRSAVRTVDDDRIPAGDLRGIIQSLAVRVGLPATVSGHSLRRSWATHRYLEDPDDLAAISRQLRHADGAMTVRYIEDLRLGRIDPALYLAADEVLAGPGGKRAQRKDLGFDTAELHVHLERVESLLAPQAAVAPGTTRTRESHWRVWERFAADHGLPAMPATEEGIALLVAQRVRERRRPRFVRDQLRTIAQRHETAGEHVPHLLDLAYELLDAYERCEDRPSTTKAPVLSRGDLLAMAGRLAEHDGVEAAMGLVLVAVGYAGAMRVDDLRRARLEAIDPAPWGALLRLGSSKDNPQGVRAETVVLLRRLDALDPVAALDRFRTVTGRTAGSIVPATVRSQRAASYDTIVGRLQRAAAAGCVSVTPTGHSLRRSWATHAFEDGVDMVSIQRHLRHAELTDTRGYVESLTPWVNNAAVGLADTLLEPLVEHALEALR